MADDDRIKVLIAEDDYLVSEGIARALRQKGYELIGDASDGAEAVEMTVSLRPDVVLMDIQMPGVDGLEASRRIQEQCPTPVVVLTAHNDRKLIDEASEAGVGAYLTKPPQADEIDRAITIAMARHEDLMKLRRLSGELETRNADLEKALAEIKTLRGIVPICANCKKIRDDKGFWHQVESYVREHTEAEFSHGICPDCAKELYGPYLASG